MALDHPRDAAIDIALPQTVNALESLWRPLLEANKLKFDKESHRDFAEREAGIGFEKRLGEYLKKKSPGLDETRSVIDRLVSDANVKQARMVVDAVSRKKPDADPEVMVVMLEGLAKIGRTGNFSLGQRVNPLKKLLNHPDDAVAAAAATNLGAWQLKGADPDLLEILGDSTRAASVRRAASISLGQLRASTAAETLRKLAFEGDPADRYFAVFGLAEDNAADASKAAAELLVFEPGKTDPVALVQAFTRRNKGADFLIEALENKKPHPEVLNRLSDYHRRTGQLPRRLAQIFRPPSRDPCPLFSSRRIEKNSLPRWTRTATRTRRKDLSTQGTRLLQLPCHRPHRVSHRSQFGGGGSGCPDGLHDRGHTGAEQSDRAALRE